MTIRITKLHYASKLLLWTKVTRYVQSGYMRPLMNFGADLGTAGSSAWRSTKEIARQRPRGLLLRDLVSRIYDSTATTIGIVPMVLMTCLLTVYFTSDCPQKQVSNALDDTMKFHLTRLLIFATGFKRNCRHYSSLLRLLSSVQYYSLVSSYRYY